MRYLTAGESHGPALVGVIEGFPAGVHLDAALIDRDLKRRLEGHGRGFRAQRIEQDAVGIPAGMLAGRTLGTPLALVIENTDHKVRRNRPLTEWTAPRPGHADYAGRLRYGYDDCAPAAERASARSTAMLTAVGACAKQLLAPFGIEILSHVVAVGDVEAGPDAIADREADALRAVAAGTPLRCVDAEAEQRMIAAIDAAAEAGTTLGGVFEVAAFGLPVGLGTYAHPDRRLDAMLAADLAGIPAVKAVAFGEALAVARRTGREAHDEILPGSGPGSVRRETNRAGGLEGGVTNGMPLRVRGHVKPIATQREGLRTVDMDGGEPQVAAYVRSDTCIVPAAGVIAESVVAWRLADELVRLLGEAPLPELLRRARNLPGIALPEPNDDAAGEEPARE